MSQVSAWKSDEKHPQFLLLKSFCLRSNVKHSTLVFHHHLCNRNVPFHWACESSEISNRNFCWMESAQRESLITSAANFFWLFDICWNMQLIKLLPLHTTCSKHPYKIQPYFMRFIDCFWKLLLTCFVWTGRKIYFNVF